jgi:uncharacterized protein
LLDIVSAPSVSESSDLRVDVADLLRRPGSRRDLTLDAPIAGFSVGLVHVDEGARVNGQLALEPLSDGLVVHGDVWVEWRAECARCLDEIRGQTRVAVDELYEPQPTEGETYALEGSEIDLEPLVRDVLGVELPLAPAPPSLPDGRCASCLRAPDTTHDVERDGRDPRWAALDELDL